MKCITFLVIAATLGLTTCAQSSFTSVATLTATATRDVTITPGPIVPPSVATGRFQLDSRQAGQVTVIVEFIRAFNNGQLEAAVALLDDQVVGSDCDYETAHPRLFNGRDGTIEWLRQRIADRDQLSIATIEGDAFALGISYARRTSMTLQRLGYSEGIKPKLGTKVILTSQPIRISRFSNGPGGGDPSLCQPEP